MSYDTDNTHADCPMHMPQHKCVCQMHMPLMWTHACTLVHMPYICPMHPTRIPQGLSSATLVIIGGIAAVCCVATAILTVVRNLSKKRVYIVEEVKPR